MYSPVFTHIPVRSHERIKRAIHDGKSFSVKVDLKHEPTHEILLTNGQKNRLERAKVMGKHGTRIQVSPRQVEANVVHGKGLLSILAKLAAMILPAVMGSGLFLSKNGHVARVQGIQGGGLYLSPHARAPEREGLYLVSDDGNVYHGDGLLLGKNSPFRNIPILNILL